MKLKILLIFFALLIAIFAFGPRADYTSIGPYIQSCQISLSKLDQHIREREQHTPHLKTGNESRFIWTDSIRQTPYSIVYLHGFSASPMEGDPLVFDIAKRYGCNLFLVRLNGHGLEDEDAFSQVMPADLINSAKEAIAIGRVIGKKVIVMSCSTGSTLAIYLSAMNPDFVAGHLMYSPNFGLYDKTTELLTMPWGLQLAKLITGDSYHSFSLPEACRPFWTMRYRLEGLVCMKTLLEECARSPIFEKINTPYFLGYYYKNEEEKDKVISIEAIQAFNDQTTTPDKKKRCIAFANVDSHVILNDCQSADVALVREHSYRFIEEVLGLEAKNF